MSCTWSWCGRTRLRLRVGKILVLAGVMAVGSLAAANAETVPQPLTPSLRHVLQAYLADPVPDTDPQFSRTKTRVYAIRVTQSGKSEILAYLAGPWTCGSGGCNLLVLVPYRKSYRIISSIDVVEMPIRILRTVSHGRPDIGVWVRDYGKYADTGYEARLRFNGKSYPENPTIPPAQPLLCRVAGEVVMADRSKSELLYR